MYEYIVLYKQEVVYLRSWSNQFELSYWLPGAFLSRYLYAIYHILMQLSQTRTVKCFLMDLPPPAIFLSPLWLHGGVSQNGSERWHPSCTLADFVRDIGKNGSGLRNISIAVLLIKITQNWVSVVVWTQWITWSANGRSLYISFTATPMLPATLFPN